MKCPIYEMSYLWNVPSMKCPIYEMSDLWNVPSMKCPIYEMSYLWNVPSMKCPIYELSYLWNVPSMNCPNYEMFCLWNFFIWNVFLWNVITFSKDNEKSLRSHLPTLFLLLATWVWLGHVCLSKEPSDEGALLELVFTQELLGSTLELLTVSLLWSWFREFFTGVNLVSPRLGRERVIFRDSLLLPWHMETFEPKLKGIEYLPKAQIFKKFYIPNIVFFIKQKSKFEI